LGGSMSFCSKEDIRKRSLTEGSVGLIKIKISRTSISDTACNKQRRQTTSRLSSLMHWALHCHQTPPKDRGPRPFRTVTVSSHAFLKCPLWVIKQTYAAQQIMSALPPIATAKADICASSCPLYPRKRTCAVQTGMSALGQKRTHALQQTIFYSMTSSARSTSVGGTVRLSALAAFKLTMSSNFVGC
jgi:hypothetical protein